MKEKGHAMTPDIILATFLVIGIAAEFIYLAYREKK